MSREQEGRCPECGELVTVERIPGKPGQVEPHACRGRVCVYPGCRVKGLMEQMVQIESGEWYCPAHGLLLAAKDLVALYFVEGEADWTAIAEIISETLPDLIAKAEARQ